jgi:hypothetical protein
MGVAVGIGSMRIEGEEAAQSTTLPDASVPPMAPQTAPYKITFNGPDVVSAWTNAATSLAAHELIGQVRAGAFHDDSLCSVAKRVLGFDNGRIKLPCTDELNALLQRLNPEFASSSRSGNVVVIPDLRVEPIVQTVFYDSTQQSDVLRLKGDLNYYRKDYLLEQTDQNGGLIRVVYQAYVSVLRVAPNPQNEELLRSLSVFDKSTGQFSVSVERLFNSADPVRFTHAPLREWLGNCKHTARSTPGYSTYLGQSENPSCENNCVAPNLCPEVTLFDRPVAHHVALASALGIQAQGAAARGRNACPALKNWSDEFHGTHLAGIVAARSKPLGLAPFSSLRSVDDRAGIPELEDVLEDEASRPNGTNIVLVAQKFVDNPELARKPGADEDATVANSSFAVRVKNAANVLWVVAAGEPRSGTGEDIWPIDSNYPMNLGTLRNVIVVTACEDCYGDKPHIAPWANFSYNRLVSVAAPGGTDNDKIISTADENSYTEGFGTSQAAAFVAGVAAAMRSCNTALLPAQIKERLVVTANPILNGSQGNKINSGVVNARAAAYLDATHTWVTLHRDGLPRAYVNVKWCRRDLHVLHLPGNPSRDDSTVVSATIRRIKAAGTQQYPGFMLAYIDKRDPLNQVLWTYHPVALDSPEDRQPLFSAQLAGSNDTTFFYPADIADVILTTEGALVAQVQCPGNP